MPDAFQFVFPDFVILVILRTRIRPGSRDQQFQEFLFIIAFGEGDPADDGEIELILLTNQATWTAVLSETLSELKPCVIQVPVTGGSSDDLIGGELAAKLAETGRSASRWPDGDGLDLEMLPESTYGIEVWEFDASLDSNFPPAIRLEMMRIIPEWVSQAVANDKKSDRYLPALACKYHSTGPSALRDDVLSGPAIISVFRRVRMNDRRESRVYDITSRTGDGTVLSPFRVGPDIPTDAVCLHWRDDDDQIAAGFKTFLMLEAGKYVSRLASEDQIIDSFSPDKDTANVIDALVEKSIFGLNFDVETDWYYDREVCGGTAQWPLHNLRRLI